MRTPTTLKEVQSLVERLISLSRFLPRLAGKIRPILKTLKNADKFEWSNECQTAFEAVKTTVSSVPILQKPVPGSKLLLYIFVSKSATSAALVQQEGQKLVYFVGRALQDAVTKYQLIEKAVLVIVYVARRLSLIFRVTASR